MLKFGQITKPETVMPSFWNKSMNQIQMDRMFTGELVIW